MQEQWHKKYKASLSETKKLRLSLNKIQAYNMISTNVINKIQSYNMISAYLHKINILSETEKAKKKKKEQNGTNAQEKFKKTKTSIQNCIPFQAFDLWCMTQLRWQVNLGPLSIIEEHMKSENWFLTRHVC